MLGLLQRATSNLKNAVSGSQWEPSDDLPSGFHRFKQQHSLPLSSFGTFAFAATGYYSKGTILLRRQGDAAAKNGANGHHHPPAYGDDDVDQKQRAAGDVHVQVEARSNSEGLYADSRLEPVEGHERCGISLTVSRSDAGIMQLNALLMLLFGSLADSGVIFGRADRRRALVSYHRHVPCRLSDPRHHLDRRDLVPSLARTVPRCDQVRKY